MFTKDELKVINSIFNDEIRETKAKLRMSNFALEADGDRMQTKTLIEFTREIRENEDLLKVYEDISIKIFELLHAESCILCGDSEVQYMYENPDRHYCEECHEEYLRVKEI